MPRELFTKPARPAFGFAPKKPKANYSFWNGSRKDIQAAADRVLTRHLTAPRVLAK